MDPGRRNIGSQDLQVDFVSPARLPNGRDLGGHLGSDNRIVKSGLVYRSGMLINPDLADSIAALNVGQVFDLRTEDERTAQPDVLPTTAELVIADVLADDPGSGPASLGKIARVAASGQSIDLTADQLRETFRTGYRAFVSLDSAQDSSARLLRTLADPQAPPLIVHCTAGKDRTGWLIALALLALGVSQEQVMADYLASIDPVWEMFAPYRDEFSRRGGDVELMRVAIGVYPEYLEAALDEVQVRYGSLDTFLVDGLGLPADIRQRLADRMLEP